VWDGLQFGTAVWSTGGLAGSPHDEAEEGQPLAIACVLVDTCAVKRLTLVVTIGLLVATAPANAAPPITVASPSSLTVQAGERKPSTVTLRNDDTAPVTLTVNAVLGEGTAEVMPKMLTLDQPVQSFQITVTPSKSTLDTSGVLSFAAPASTVPPAVLALEIEPEQQHDTAAAILIFAPAFLAVVVVLWRLLTVKIVPPFGPPNWKYSESWASTLTLIGALLGTLLGAGVLPDKLALFSKAGYSAFNVFFGMLVLIAPLVYAALQTRVTDAADKSQQYQGTTLAFGLASIATLWGVFGQLATVGLLFREIEKAGGLSTWLVLVSGAILLLIFAAALAYVWKRMRQIAEGPKAPRTAGLAPPDDPDAKAWSLL
jgi:hypothetical protein